MSMEGQGGDAHRRGYRVIGRVQGVGFRWWTQRTAVGLGLGGWVRNEPDGSVVVQATGPAAALAELEEALRRGPIGARVDRIEAIALEGTVFAIEFRIEA